MNSATRWVFTCIASAFLAGIGMGICGYMKGHKDGKIRMALDIALSKSIYDLSRTEDLTDWEKSILKRHEKDFRRYLENNILPRTGWNEDDCYNISLRGFKSWMKTWRARSAQCM